MMMREFIRNATGREGFWENAGHRDTGPGGSCLARSTAPFPARTPGAHWSVQGSDKYLGHNKDHDVFFYCSVAVHVIVLSDKKTIQLILFGPSCDSVQDPWGFLDSTWRQVDQEQQVSETVSSDSSDRDISNWGMMGNW